MTLTTNINNYKLLVVLSTFPLSNVLSNTRYSRFGMADDPDVLIRRHIFQEAQHKISQIYSELPNLKLFKREFEFPGGLLSHVITPPFELNYRLKAR